MSDVKVPAAFLLCNMQRGLENQTIHNSLKDLDRIMVDRIDNYRRQVKTHGEGNTEHFLDELEDAREKLREFAELAGVDCFDDDED